MDDGAYGFLVDREENTLKLEYKGVLLVIHIDRQFNILLLIHYF